MGYCVSDLYSEYLKKNISFTSLATFRADICLFTQLLHNDSL